MRRIGRHNQDVPPHRVDALVVGGEAGAPLPPIVNCDNASHATSRYFNESNQPFSPDEAPRSLENALGVALVGIRSSGPPRLIVASVTRSRRVLRPARLALARRRPSPAPAPHAPRL